MSVSRFEVRGQLDNAGEIQKGTVTIDRNAGLFSVRPFRRRRIYTLPLNLVADMVIHRLLLAEMAERRREKKRAGK